MWEISTEPRLLESAWINLDLEDSLKLDAIHWFIREADKLDKLNKVAHSI